MRSERRSSEPFVAGMAADTLVQHPPVEPVHDPQHVGQVVVDRFKEIVRKSGEGLQIFRLKIAADPLRQIAAKRRLDARGHAGDQRLHFCRVAATFAVVRGGCLGDQPVALDGIGAEDVESPHHGADFRCPPGSWQDDICLAEGQAAHGLGHLLQPPRHEMGEAEAETKQPAGKHRGQDVGLADGGDRFLIGRRDSARGRRVQGVGVGFERGFGCGALSAQEFGRRQSRRRREAERDPQACAPGGECLDEGGALPIDPLDQLVLAQGLEKLVHGGVELADTGLDRLSRHESGHAEDLIGKALHCRKMGHGLVGEPAAGEGVGREMLGAILRFGCLAGDVERHEHTAQHGDDERNDDLQTQRHGSARQLGRIGREASCFSAVSVCMKATRSARSSSVNRSGTSSGESEGRSTMPTS